MINPNELHIGNRVTVLVPMANGPAVRTEVEVYGILKAPLNDPKGQPVIVFEHNGKYYDAFLNENVQPVELTPEALERCGLRLLGDGTWHKDGMNRWRVVYDEVENAAFWCTCEYPELGRRIYLPGRIEHLHQLQNLYRDLMQEELTIKEIV